MPFLPYMDNMLEIFELASIQMQNWIVEFVWTICGIKSVTENKTNTRTMFEYKMCSYCAKHVEYINVVH